MKRKKSFFYVLLVFLTGSVTASHGASSSLGSIGGVISAIGLESGNLVHNLGIAATFGLLWLSVYMILKKLVVRFELQELFNLESRGAQDEGKNILAVLALLIIISMMGAGHWIEPLGLIWDIQQLFLTALLFGVIALLISVIGGGTAGVAWTAGQTGQALNEGMQEIQEARQDLQNIGSGNSNNSDDSDTAVDLENAVDDIENAYSHVEPALHEAEKDLGSDIQEIINAVNDPDTASAEYRRVGDQIENFRRALQLTYQTAKNNTGYTKDDIRDGKNDFQHDASTLDDNNLPDKYSNFGLRHALTGLKQIESAVERIENKEEHDVGILDDELNSLIQDTKSMVKSVKALQQIFQEVKEAENKEDVFEEAANEIDDRKMFDHHRRMKKHEEYLENHLEKDKSELKDIRDDLKDARRRIKKELGIEDPDDVKEMAELLGSGPSSTKGVEKLLSSLRTQLSGEFSDMSGIDGPLSSIEDVRSEVQALILGVYNAETHKIEDDEKILEQIDEAIDAIEEVIDT